jgi:L-iditol 2-dehydrogenase
MAWTSLGGLVAGESLVVTGPGPIGLMGIAAGKALGADPVVLTGTRDARLELGKKLGADYTSSTCARKTRSSGSSRSWPSTACPAPSTSWSAPARQNSLNEAMLMCSRGGRICLAAFPGEPVPVDLAQLVRNNIYVYGIRGEGKSAVHRGASMMTQNKFDAKLMHTHTFGMDEVPKAFKYQMERIEDAIKVVVKNHQ